MDTGEKPWFRERTFGYGYGPSSWQGWLATAVFVAVLVGTGKLAQYAIAHYHLSHKWHYAVVALFVVYLAVFLRIIFTHRGPA